MDKAFPYKAFAHKKSRSRIERPLPNLNVQPPETMRLSGWTLEFLPLNWPDFPNGITKRQPEIPVTLDVVFTNMKRAAT
jgi:hypothetical protein